jgi:hypothetical protein
MRYQCHDLRICFEELQHQMARRSMERTLLAD